ncbi:hypothetical protein FOXYS1_13607 [Fusarium oxysporum]|uniref:Uncharacterized protein n=1 Tax=Fusarium oxysporum TaxID=5507 RepID=A0A8H5A1U8_FUSOX|nr:hypothetical protein FOXYS1_13607 [Fusarium oxysporum]
MSEQIPQFFLYSHGIPTGNLTLGTLVFGNYAQPESSPSALFQGLLDSVVVSSQEVSGYWVNSKSSKYGLGIDSNVVFANKGSRRTLKDPQVFLNNYVLRSPSTRARLAQWLTAAKSSYLYRKATFQKPRVYYVTGVYELDDAYAWVSRGSESTAGMGVDAAVMGLATGTPVGINIGPFEQSTQLTFRGQVKGRQVWAARFHQLRVDYVRQSVDSDLSIPSNIFLLDDETVGSGAVMGSESPVVDKLACKRDECIFANGVDIYVSDSVEEPIDGEKDYLKVWNEAVSQLNEVAADRLEAEEDNLS